MSATSDAITFAGKHNCTDGDDATVRKCLRAIPTSAVLPGPGFGAYIGGRGEDALLPDLPFNLYAKGEFDTTIKVMAGHNSGESVEMKDSCFNNPTLTLANMPASFDAAMSTHNRIQPPSWLQAEAVERYLPNRTNGLPPCSPDGDASNGIPKCCRIYEDFWQDLQMQCSEEVLFDAVRNGGVGSKGGVVPQMYGWRFDQVQDCPPPLWPQGGWGGKLVRTDSCFHTMELSWMFGTVSGFWSWIVPPNSSREWNCSWGADERAFSTSAISLWVQQALGSGDVGTSASGSGSGGGGGGGGGGGNGVLPLWPKHTAQNRSRLNLKVGNISVLNRFREPYCNWWSTVYTRIRKSQGF